MPVARGPSIDARRAVTAGVLGVVVAVVIGVAILWAGNTGGDIESNLGDQDFRDIDADDIADEIADRGPVGFNSVGGQARPIWLQHLGDDPETGWIALEARIPDQPGCLAQWDREREVFFNDCDDTETFPPDGAGLTSIPLLVEDGEVIVDLNNRRADEDEEGPS